MALIQQLIVLSMVFAFGFLTYDHMHGGDRYLKPWAHKAQSSATSQSVTAFGRAKNTIAGNAAGTAGLRQVAHAESQAQGQATVVDEAALSPEEKMGRDLRRAQDAMKQHQQALKVLTQD